MIAKSHIKQGVLTGHVLVSLVAYIKNTGHVSIKHRRIEHDMIICTLGGTHVRGCSCAYLGSEIRGTRDYLVSENSKSQTCLIGVLILGRRD